MNFEQNKKDSLQVTWVDGVILPVVHVDCLVGARNQILKFMKVEQTQKFQVDYIWHAIFEGDHLFIYLGCTNTRINLENTSPSSR